MTATRSTPSVVRRIGLLGALALAVTLPIASAVAAAATSEAADSDLGYFLFILAIGILGITAASVGVVILWRTSGNVIGAMLLVGALLLMSTFLAWPTAAYRAATVGSTDIIGGLALWWSSNSILAGVFLLFPGVGILFPDGRLPGPRWRLPFAAVVTLLAVSAVLQTIAQWPPEQSDLLNPFALPGVPMDVYRFAGGFGALAVFTSFGLAVVAVSVRFRRSVGVERAQLKWLVASISVMAIAFPVSFGTDIGPAYLIDLASVVAGCLIPVAVGIAILRHRLYDIDRIISRTLAYAALTAALAAVYVAAFIALQAVLAPLTSSGGSLAVAASTLAVFALFQPLRRRLHSTMDRRFNRSRYDAPRIVEAFAGRLRDEVDLDRLGDEVQAVVGQTLAPASVGVWFRPTHRVS